MSAENRHSTGDRTISVGNRVVRGDPVTVYHVQQTGPLTKPLESTSGRSTILPTSDERGLRSQISRTVLQTRYSNQSDVQPTGSELRFPVTQMTFPGQSSRSQETVIDGQNQSDIPSERCSGSSYNGTNTNLSFTSQPESHPSSGGLHEHRHQHLFRPSRLSTESFSHASGNGSMEKPPLTSETVVLLQQRGESAVIPSFSAPIPTFSRRNTSSDYSTSEPYDTTRDNTFSIGRSDFPPSLYSPMYGSGSSNGSFPLSLGNTSTQQFESPADPALEKLKKLISEGDYMTFIHELGGTVESPKKSLYIEALRLFRFYVVRDQMSTPNICVLTTPDWVKEITNKARTTFNGDKDVVVSCLLTFLTFSALPGDSYNRFTIVNGGVDFTLDLMDEYKMDEDVSNLSMALILSLSLNRKDGLCAKYAKIEMLVRRLCTVLSSGDFGKDFAIRALFHLSYQEKLLVTKALSLESSIGEMIKSLNSNGVRQPTAEAVLSILWRKSPKPTVEGAEGDGSFPITIEVIQTIIDTIDSFDSIPIWEACCGIVANLSMRDCFPSEMSQAVLVSLLRFLNDDAYADEKLATYAIHLICNLLQNPMARTFLVSDERAVKTILSLMERYSTCKRLIEYGCLALGHAGRNDCTVKETIMLLGGLDLVKKALETFYGSEESNRDRSVEDASFCAIASLSGCYSGATAVKNSGLLENIENILLVDPEDEDIKASMEVIVSNTRKGFPSGHVEFGQNTLQQKSDQFAQLVGAATSEGTVVRLFQGIVGSSQSNVSIVAGRGVGYAGYTALLSAMSKHDGSSDVQAYGSILLAEMYFHLSLETVEYDTQGLWSPRNLSITLQTIHNAMSCHRNNGAVQSYCCLAMLNILTPLSDRHSSSLKRQAVGSLVEMCLHDNLESLHVHGSNREVQKKGVAALGATVLVAHQEILDRWKHRIVNQIFLSIQKFSHDNELLQMALDTLQLLHDSCQGIESIQDDPNIRQLLDLTRSDSSEISGRSCAILASFCRTDCSHLKECPDIVQMLLLGMESNPQDLQIQINLMSILETLVNFGDDVTFAKIYENKGIETLCNGIRKHPSSSKLVLLACRILSTSILLLGRSAAALPRNVLKESLMNSAVRHQEDSDVEAVIFDALCACCQLDDCFNQSLLEEAQRNMETNVNTMVGTLHIGQIVVGAMQLNLGAADLQRSGCNLLWSLSRLGSGKEIIGKFAGIQTIINAMLAHIDSAAVQKEGLSALSRLATASQNKRLIDDADPERVVLWSLWIHYRDPSVLSVGFSALNNIQVDFQTRKMKKSKMDENILTIVVAAMGRFPGTEQLQRNACSYLYNCSFTPENLGMMGEKRELLVPLLRQAAEQFPLQCSKAGSLMKKLLQNV